MTNTVSTVLLIILWLIVGIVILTQDGVTPFQYGLLLICYIVRLITDLLKEVM